MRRSPSHDGGLAIDRAAWTNRWRDRSVREKAVLSLGLLLAAMISRVTWLDALILVGCLAALLFGARISPRLLLRVITLPVTFIAIAAVGAAVSIGHPPASTLASFGPFSVTQETLDRSILTTCRSLATAAAVLLLGMTTPMPTLLSAARRAHVPAAMTDLAGLVYRMLFILLDTIGTIRRTQEARLGYDHARTARQSMAQLLSSTLRVAWNRAARLNEGLEARGFDGSLAVTQRHHAMSAGFLAAAVVTATAANALAVMTW